MENWKINPIGNKHYYFISSDTKGSNESLGKKLQMDYYNGYLIAESIGSLETAKLISAAPDMLDALLNLENDAGSIPKPIWEKVTSAISKALVKVETFPPVIYPERVHGTSPGIEIGNGGIGKIGSVVYQKQGDKFGKSNSILAGKLGYGERFFVIWDDDPMDSKNEIGSPENLFLKPEDAKFNHTELKFCMIRKDLSTYDFGLDIHPETEYRYRWLNDDEGFQIFFQNKWYDMESIDFDFIEPITPGVRTEPGLLIQNGEIASPGSKVYQKTGDNFGKSNSVQSGILMHDENEFYIIWDDDEDHTRCKITDASTLYLIK